MLAQCAALGAACLVLLPSAAGATPVCRWVDDGGRTHVADNVPERYRATATCTDSQKYELTPAQQRAAQQRVADDRAKAARAAAVPAPRAASATASQPAARAPGRAVKRPAEVVTDTTDCATWWRLYDESAACFGPFRTTRGATKAEAFDVCNVIVSPESRCGPRTE